MLTSQAYGTTLWCCVMLKLGGLLFKCGGKKVNKSI